MCPYEIVSGLYRDVPPAIKLNHGEVSQRAVGHLQFLIISGFLADEEPAAVSPTRASPTVVIELPSRFRVHALTRSLPNSGFSIPSWGINSLGEERNGTVPSGLCGVTTKITAGLCQ